VISVVIPTVKGREYSLDRTLKGYQETYDDIEIIGIPNTGKPCGIAWAEGAKEASGDYIHITADDLVPHPGWAEAAIACADAGIMPAASVYGIESEQFAGGLMNCIFYGLPRWTDCPNVLLPFLTREQLEMGGWFIPTHYGTDDWVTYLARTRGIHVERSWGYAFDHYAVPEERQNSRPLDVPNLATAMQQHGYVPLVYGQAAASFGWAGWVG